MDAFCAQSGGDWHWRGARTAHFDPSRVLLMLSDGGSDQTRMVEFDCDAGALVEGGFDLPPSRSSVNWLDEDTLLWASAAPGDATRASWPGTVRRLTRAGGMEAAEELFRAEPDDVAAHGFSLPQADGGRLLGVARVIAIGKTEVTLFLPDGPMVVPSPTDTNVQLTDSHFAYVVTETGGAPGALMLGRHSDGGTREIWRPGPGQAVRGGSVILLENWLLWSQTDRLRPSLWALSLRDPDAAPQMIEPPEQAELMVLGAHDATPGREAGTKAEPLVLHLQGLLRSPVSFLFDLDAGPEGARFEKLLEQPQEFDPSGLVVELFEATSDDGTKVPYHLVRPEGEGPVPAVVYGYGGFSVGIQAHYNRVVGALWLERGGAYVVAHIRGGDELGPEWHLQAKGAGRPLAYADFAAIAADLAARGVTTPAQTGCHGGSNGGLLTGVMLNRYPEHFGAVWSDVGVYDMLRFHKFPAGRAWIDEYGDPDDPEAAEWLRAYSPLHTVPGSDTALPAALITTSDNDDRVDPSHARRYAAALLEAGHSPNFYQHGGGHGGGGSSHAQAREAALGYGFLAHHLGLR